ncbi:quercetin dioxygenase-like cupin family protein [Luteibacter sp. HA06]
MSQQHGETALFTGSRVRELIAGRETGGQFCMLEFTSPAGRGTPLHMHERETESVHLLSGELIVTVGEETFQLVPGDSIVLKPHQAHRLVTGDNEDARYIVVCAPAGFEDFAASCVKSDDGNWPPAPPSRKDIDTLLSHAGRFGITIFPPGKGTPE